MQLLYFYPIWSVGELQLPEALDRISEEGYDGAELAIDPFKEDLPNIELLFKERDLLLLAQHPFAIGDDFDAYRTDYSAKLSLLAQLNTPYINCHTGRDYFSFEQNVLLIQDSIAISKESNKPIGHEIHRGRFSFHPKITMDYLKKCPEMVVTADFSHWCVVTESLLEHFGNELNQMYPHVAHLHARVGDGESPQVNHQFAPENMPALEAHLKWWQAIKKTRQPSGQPLLVTCECGPPPYQQTLPFTQMPVGNIWELNRAMMKYLKQEL